MSKINSCFAQFFYRVHSNKTVEAICGFCFVASNPTSDQQDLRAWEKAHVCSVRKEPSANGRTGPACPAFTKPGHSASEVFSQVCRRQ